MAAVDMEKPAAQLHEGAAGDTESDEEEEVASGSESGSSDSGAESGAKAASKKKKKKKKKKSGGGGGGAAGGGGGGAQPPVDPAARKEGERRYQEAVDQLSHNSEDSMWVKLGGCHLADGKLKKLCEALRGNTTVISLDLSSNQLTDEGAKVLAAALRDGRAPDLIDLDLRDNPQIVAESEGAAALKELQQQRKTLKVAVGPSQPPAPPPQQQQPRSPKQGQQQGGGGQPPPPQQQQQQQQPNGSLADSVKNNPVINKYFAVGNDEADEEEQRAGEAGGAAGGDGEGEEHLGGLTAAELAHILWEQLEQCLDAPQPDIPAVSEPLRAIAEQVEHEMDNCALPMLANTEMGELKTFTQWALRKLHVLHSVLDLVPPPLLTPYSKTQPVPAVGTHRAAVAELLAQLLRAECPVVAQQVAASGVLRRCAVVAVEHPNCSAIHGAVGRCLRFSLSPAVGGVGLWQQLLGSAPVAAPEGALSGDRGGSLNLAAEAAAIVAAAKRDAPSIGKRPSNVGFALAVGQLLHHAATGERLGAGAGEPPAGDAPGGGEGADAPAAGGDEQPADAEQQEAAEAPAGESSAAGSDAEAAAAAEAGSQLLAEKPPEHSGLRRVRSDAAIPRVASAAVSDLPGEGESWQHSLRMALESAEAWVEFSAGPDSLLRTMLGEQVGDLGGPRPRPGGEPELDSDDADVSAGQTISGQELLMMLRGLNLGGFSGGM